MGDEKRLFKSKEQKSRADVSEFLLQLAARIAEGRMVFSQDQEELAVQLPENLILEVQVEEEDKGPRGTQYSVELELKWFDGAQEGPLELK